MGASLRARTQHGMVLLHTAEVPPPWLRTLRAVGWTLRCVGHVPYLPSLYPKGRSKGVFTKLKALSLEAYHRVILLDTDMLVRQSADEIFLRDAPAAVRRHPMGKYLDHEGINGKSLFRDRTQIGGINAGFVLLEPSVKDLHRMEFQLQTGMAPGEVPFRAGPEQDYLTRFYGGDNWTSVGIQWNYQLHQVAYCSRPGLLKSVRMSMGYRGVEIVHFSGTQSPAHWLLDPSCHDRMSFDDYVENNIIAGFLRNAHGSKPRRAGAPRTRAAAESKLRKITHASTREWHDEYERLDPSIKRLVDEERARRRARAADEPRGRGPPPPGRGTGPGPRRWRILRRRPGRGRRLRTRLNPGRAGRCGADGGSGSAGLRKLDESFLFCRPRGAHQPAPALTHTVSSSS